MMRLGSPSAWASTQWMTLAVRIHGTLPGMSGRLEGKIAVVTGAGSGIGRATARRFAAEGAYVIAADKDLETAHETCAGLDATAVETDVDGREAQIEAMLATVDHLDIYFNNAGIPERVKPLAEITREEWDAVIDVNLTSLFVAAQVAAPKLKGGVLLVTGSIIANRPRPGLAAYVASKNGVIGLARALAVELAPDIRVNVINPGPANTPMLGGFGFGGNPADNLPLRRLVRARGHRRRRDLPRLRRGARDHRRRLQRRRRPRPVSFFAVDPSTGHEFAELPVTSSEQVAELVEDAHRALAVEHEWRTPHVRAQALTRLARAVEGEHDKLAELETRDTGKPLKQAKADVVATVRYLDYYAGSIERLEGRQIPLGPGALDYTVREPWGVCGQIIPWNYPLQITARCAAPGTGGRQRGDHQAVRAGLDHATALRAPGRGGGRAARDAPGRHR